MPFDGVAGDDQSVANAIAQRYIDGGIDPARAYDDPEAALQDFDLKSYGF
jgi:hypothetical protein